MLDYVETGESYLDNWPVNSFDFNVRIILFTYLFKSGLKLLETIKKYTTMRPTKLVWNIYIILTMVWFYIPYHLSCLAIDLFDQDYNTDESM
jgi:hypothetical protein